MNTHKNKNHPEVKWERKFLGKIKDFKDKEEQRFEQKHLRAYIQGRTEFKWGMKEIENPITKIVGLYPNMVEVKQSLKQIN